MYFSSMSGYSILWNTQRPSVSWLQTLDLRLYTTLEMTRC